MKLIIHADGGSRGNPGPAACGVVIEDEQGKQIAKLGKSLGVRTNNQAEYSGVIAALELIKNILLAKNKVSLLDFYLDSDLIVNQLSGKYKIKSPELAALAIKAKNLEKEISVSVTYKYIPREQNKTADKIVNQVLDSKIPVYETNFFQA
jgi:ribonuclease HI